MCSQSKFGAFRMYHCNVHIEKSFYEIYSYNIQFCFTMATKLKETVEKCDKEPKPRNKIGRCLTKTWNFSQRERNFLLMQFFCRITCFLAWSHLSIKLKFEKLEVSKTMLYAKIFNFEMAICYAGGKLDRFLQGAPSTSQMTTWPPKMWPLFRKRNVQVKVTRRSWCKGRLNTKLWSLAPNWGT